MSAKTFLKTNKTGIGLGVGYVSMAASIILAIRAGRNLDKNLKKLDEEVKKNPVSPKKYKVLKTFTIAKTVAPAVIAGAVSATSFAFVHKEQNKKIALAVSSAIAADEAKKAIEKKLVEVGGEKLAKDVEHAVNQEKADKGKCDPDVAQKCQDARNGDTIDNNASYKQLFFEPMTEQYFRSSIDDIRRYEGRIRTDLLGGDNARLDDFLWMLGIHTLPATQNYVWIAADWYSKRNHDIIDLSETVMSPQGIPAIKLSYEVFIDPDCIPDYKMPSVKV